MKTELMFLLLFVFLLSACSSPDSGSDKPPIEFDSMFLNQQVKLVALENLSSFKTKDPVSLMLEYYSENKIVFPSNFGLRIFMWQDENWIELKEKPSIRSSDEVVLSPELPTSQGEIVMFSPQLGNLSENYHIRVYVFGDMYTLEGIKRVAAFVDFILTP